MEKRRDYTAAWGGWAQGPKGEGQSRGHLGDGPPRPAAGIPVAWAAGRKGHLTSCEVWREGELGGRRD